MPYVPPSTPDYSVVIDAGKEAIGTVAEASKQADDSVPTSTRDEPTTSGKK